MASSLKVTKPVYIVDIVGEVVRNITPAILPIIKANEQAAFLKLDPTGKTITLIDTIDYQFGHAIELIQTLSQMDRSPQMKRIKYPLIYLVQDFTEFRGKTAGIYATTKLDIIIAHQTDPNYKMPNRMDYVFRPVLYPIYYALLDGLATHGLVNESTQDLMQHGKTDRSYWGKVSVGGNESNKINDYVDAMEISNLGLTILYKDC